MGLLPICDRSADQICSGGSSPHQLAVILSTGGSAAQPLAPVISSSNTPPLGDGKLPSRTLKHRLCIGWFGRQVSLLRDVRAGQDSEVMVESSGVFSLGRVTEKPATVHIAHTSLLYARNGSQRGDWYCGSGFAQVNAVILAWHAKLPRANANATRLSGRGASGSSQLKRPRPAKGR